MAEGNRSGLSGGYSYKLDLDLDKIANAVAIYGDEIAFVGVPRAMNYGGRAGNVRLIRALAGQTGLASGLIRKHVKTVRATRNNWSFTWRASATPLGLSHFGLTGKGGRGSRGRQRNIWARPWGVKTVFKNAFIISPKGGGSTEAYKRVGKGKREIKMLYGPLISYEMVRVGGGHPRPTVETILATAEDIMIRRLPHEMSYAFQIAKAKSGT